MIATKAQDVRLPWIESLPIIIGVTDQYVFGYTSPETDNMLHQLEYMTWEQIAKYVKEVSRNRIVQLDYLELDWKDNSIIATYEPTLRTCGIAYTTPQTITSYLISAGDHYSYEDYVKIGKQILCGAYKDLERTTFDIARKIKWLTENMPRATLTCSWPESQEMSELKSAKLVESGPEGPTVVVNAIEYLLLQLTRGTPSGIVNET